MTSDIRKDLMAAAEGLDALSDAAEESESYEGTEEPEEVVDDSEVSEDDETDTDIPQTEAEGEEEGATDDEVDSASLEEEAAQSEASDDVPAPEQWVAAMRQKWVDLPGDVRKYILQRESQQHAYISKIGQQFATTRRAFDEIEKAFKPVEADIQKAGVTRAQVVERLLAERGEMMKDPSGFIKKFADIHRISLHDLANDPEMSEPAEVRQARWQLRDQEQALESQRQAVLEQQQRIELGQLGQYIEGWGAQKPHFALVRQAMAQILPQVQSDYPYLSFEEQLETTYNTTMRHPSFAHLVKPKPVPVEARRAASGISGKSGVPVRSKEPANIREALMQAAKETGYI